MKKSELRKIIREEIVKETGLTLKPRPTNQEIDDSTHVYILKLTDNQTKSQLDDKLTFMLLQFKYDAVVSNSTLSGKKYKIGIYTPSFTKSDKSLVRKLDDLMTNFADEIGAK